jgi:hypothetical protein
LECLLCDISKQPTDLSYIKTQIDWKKSLPR